MSAVMYAGSAQPVINKSLPSEHDLTFERVDFDRVRGLIYERAGISLGDGKQAMVYSRLSRRLRDTGQPSLK